MKQGQHTVHTGSGSANTAIIRVAWVLGMLWASLAASATPPTPDPSLTIWSRAAACVRAVGASSIFDGPETVQANMEATRDVNLQLRCRDSIKTIQLVAGQQITQRF